MKLKKKSKLEIDRLWDTKKSKMEFGTRRINRTIYKFYKGKFGDEGRKKVHIS